MESKEASCWCIRHGRIKHRSAQRLIEVLRKFLFPNQDLIVNIWQCRVIVCHLNLQDPASSTGRCRLVFKFTTTRTGCLASENACI
mmetsp:Transcript_58070/g.136886  ORF Transcript_58070/g.136886 Transcript_58070/m.136886 type:complete len:86 (+) Transcript_58070:512-769(+)